MLLGQNVFPSLIVVITFLVFLPVLNNGFVDSDKRPLVENLAYRGLGWTQLQWMFTGFHFRQFQPVAWLSFGINYLFWWADPFGYHLTNVFVHIVNTVLFYCLSMALFVRWKKIDSYPGVNWFGIPAAVAALSFGLHPLRVESVAWASNRGEMLAAMFFLLSFLGYLKGNAAEALGVPGTRWKIVSIGAFLLCLLAGPSGLFLPVILWGIDHYITKSQTLPPDGTRAAVLGPLFRTAPYLFLSCAYVVVTLVARGYDPTLQSNYRENFLIRFLYQLGAPAFYFWKAVLPIGLAPAYDFTVWPVTAFIAASIFLCGFVIAQRKKWPALVPLLLAYLLLLLPIFREEFPAEQILADRFTYLAALPWALLIAVGVERGLSLVAVRRLGSPTLVSAALCVVVGITTVAVLTWRELPVWRNSETLWSNASAVNPSSSAYHNLAMLYESQGKYDDAVMSYQRAVELNPQRWDAHERAGALLYKQGKMAEAVEHYRVFVKFNSNAIEARENLATALVNQAQTGEAVEHLRKVIELAPERNLARVKLGMILAVEGRLDEAAQVLAIAAKKDPNDGRILLQMGRVLAAQGKLNDAVNYFREATRLLPHDAEAHESLGRGQLELGNKEEGAKHLAESLRILRSSPTAR